MKIAVTSQNRREITENTAHPPRLARKGIEAVVTPEKHPDRAVSLWLAHSLARAEPHARAHGAVHGLDHDHEGGCSCSGGCDCA